MWMGRTSKLANGEVPDTVSNVISTDREGLTTYSSEIRIDTYVSYILNTAWEHRQSAFTVSGIRRRYL